MALPEVAPINLNEIYDEAVANGYVGARNLNDLDAWSGYAILPNPLSAPRPSILAFLGKNYGAPFRVGSAYLLTDNDNFVTDVKTVSLTSTLFVVAYLRQAVGGSQSIEIRPYEVNSSTGNITALSSAFTNTAAVGGTGDITVDIKRLSSTKCIIVYKTGSAYRYEVFSFSGTTVTRTVTDILDVSITYASYQTTNESMSFGVGTTTSTTADLIVIFTKNVSGDLLITKEFHRVNITTTTTNTLLNSSSGTTTGIQSVLTSLEVQSDNSFCFFFTASTISTNLYAVAGYVTSNTVYLGTVTTITTGNVDNSGLATVQLTADNFAVIAPESDTGLFIEIVSISGSTVSSSNNWNITNEVHGGVPKNLSIIYNSLLNELIIVYGEKFIRRGINVGAKTISGSLAPFIGLIPSGNVGSNQNVICSMISTDAFPYKIVLASVKINTTESNLNLMAYNY